MSKEAPTKLGVGPNGVALIEWRERGALRRGWVPVEVADDPTKAQLQAAAPFGDLTNGDLPRITVAYSDVVGFLAEKGIWTKAGLRSNKHAMAMAYADAVNVAVREWQRKKREEVT